VVGWSVLLLMITLIHPKHERGEKHLPRIAPVTGRVLARATSEGGRPIRIALSRPQSRMALSSDAKNLFVLLSDDPGPQRLADVDLESHFVQEVPLSSTGGSLTVARDGTLYIGSSVEGIMVYDSAHKQFRPNPIPTHGPVLDMALTPDGTRLFLAMGQSGV